MNEPSAVNESASPIMNNLADAKYEIGYAYIGNTLRKKLACRFYTASAGSVPTL